MRKDRKLAILNYIIYLLRFDTRYVIGICGAVERLCSVIHFITEDEHEYISNLILNNKPTPTNQFKEFTKFPSWNLTNDVMESAYWWKQNYNELNEFNREIRILYITKLINEETAKF